MLLFLFACNNLKDSDSAVELPPPTIAWLSPLDGDTIAAGTDVSSSVVVENFTLTAPVKHNEGTPVGYLSILSDGTEALQTGETTFIVPAIALGVGEHDLTAQIFYADGDEVSASSEALCDEEATEGCTPVSATIHVTVQ